MVEASEEVSDELEALQAIFDGEFELDSLSRAPGIAPWRPRACTQSPPALCGAGPALGLSARGRPPNPRERERERERERVALAGVGHHNFFGEIQLLWDPKKKLFWSTL